MMAEISRLRRPMTKKKHTVTTDNRLSKQNHKMAKFAKRTKENSFMTKSNACEMFLMLQKR